MNRQFDYANVKNPEYFCDGRMEAYSDHAYYASETDMVDGESLFAESLNGIWKFHYARNYDAVVRGFEKEEYCCASWDDIRVPAHIQMEGYDVPQYANTQYPWEGREDIRPGEIPEYFNPVASYVKYFSVPERMKGKRIFVSFQGAESGLAVWLNGVFIGYSEDSFTPSDFELTGYLKEGQNKLAVQVFKWTAGSWCEDQDFYRFSGLYRDVFLYTVPNVHIRDLRIRAIPDETLQKAELEIVSCTWGEGKARFVLSRYGKVFVDEEKELTEEEYRRLLEVAKKRPNLRLYYVILTICGTGIRVSELKFITVDALKSGKVQIHLKGKDRTILLPQKLLGKLNQYVSIQSIRKGPVFQTRSGKPLDRSNICHEMKQICEEAKVDKEKVFPHNLRHLFARCFYAVEKNLALLADILGHSSIETTRIYVAEGVRTHERILKKMRLIV